MARASSTVKFTDRNVIDAPDGYVACESYKDSHSWEHMANMERAMQVKSLIYMQYMVNRPLFHKNHEIMIITCSGKDFHTGQEGRFNLKKMKQAF